MNALLYLLCPAGGVKLHQELSLLLGSAASATLQLAAAFYTAAWPGMGPAALLLVAAFTALGGAVVGCMAAADMLLVVTWPVALLYGAAAGLHKLQLRCLAATWRLIRGKQKVSNNGCKTVRARNIMHKQTQACIAVSCEDTLSVVP